MNRYFVYVSDTFGEGSKHFFDDFKEAMNFFDSQNKPSTIFKYFDSQWEIVGYQFSKDGSSFTIDSE